MEALTKLAGPAAPLMMPNINTDMIAPMSTPANAGKPRAFSLSQVELAKLLFASWRYDAQDNEISDFVLNRSPFRQARFLIAGDNFGCGSSRDTAPAMLSAFGIRCIVAPSFGAIFSDNCYKIGMLPMVLDETTVETLARAAEDGGDFVLDVAAQMLGAPNGSRVPFALPAFRREQLLTGADDISLTLRRGAEIAAYQERERSIRPWALRPRLRNNAHTKT
jgi:3-isopropylmalate/(R)-2-methylmalate dehydratase small subunit